MKIGIDIDGVLANFNMPFAERLAKVTGKDLCPPRPFDPTEWNWPGAFGYSEIEVNQTWEVVHANPNFWAALPAMAGATEALFALEQHGSEHDDEVYFVTARSGVAVKKQTERWLQGVLPSTDDYTVLVTPLKGLACAALQLDCYIEDNWVNALSVAQTKTRSYLCTRTWNATHDTDHTGVIRVSTVEEMLRREDAR